MGQHYGIAPPELVVKAMRDSGYRNAAYAIAELIDNSIQAGATMVELLCIEKEVGVVGKQKRTNVDEVAVLDNGSGMNSEVLRQSLQFGVGEHLDDRTGMGRFGMGLPNSSISQASHVDVWSWQDGLSSALYSYLDVTKIGNGEMSEVPEPRKLTIPKKWATVGSSKVGKSGTLVVWSQIDRCTWKTSNAIVRNCEEIVGRLYRRFLHTKQVEIRLATFRNTGLEDPEIDKLALPNDPGYLMEKTSTPDPWGDVAMFEPYGDIHQQRIKILHKEKEEEVVLTFSLAKKEARAGFNPGSDFHGKHAARNIGVSIVRAGRELDLDRKWFPGYNPVFRWAGVEVEFPPALDEIFGVTNNKQYATHLGDLAGIDKLDLAQNEGCTSYQELKKRWRDEEDIREPLLQIKDAIESNSGAILRGLKAQSKQKGRRRYDDPDSPESKATQATRKRQTEGLTGGSDAAESTLNKTEKQKELQQALIADGMDEQEATELAARTISSGLKYTFTYGESDAGAFFSVKPKGGSLIVTLNTNHAAYEHLIELLEDTDDTGSPNTEALSLDEIKDRHARAHKGLKMLLFAWARYEDECQEGPQRVNAQETREDWGRVARHFMQEQ